MHNEVAFVNVANRRGIQKSRFVALIDREKQVQAHVFFADFVQFCAILMAHLDL